MIIIDVDNIEASVNSSDTNILSETYKKSKINLSKKLILQNDIEIGR